MTGVHHAIASRVIPHLRHGDVVNLGIGIPTLVADHLPPDLDVTLQTENGMLGVGPTPLAEDVDPSLVNAGKQPVSELPGASYYSSSESFAMIRVGRIDVAVLGALEIDQRGVIANWSLPGQPILGVGGAMDVLIGARRVIVTMTHVTKSGAPKLVRKCSLPRTGRRRADVIVTEHATFVVQNDRLRLTEVAEGTTLPWIYANTEAGFDLELTHAEHDASEATSR